MLFLWTHFLKIWNRSHFGEKRQLKMCSLHIDLQAVIHFLWEFLCKLPYWEYANDIRHDYWFSLNRYSSVGKVIRKGEQEISFLLVCLLQPSALSWFIWIRSAVFRFLLRYSKTFEGLKGVNSYLSMSHMCFSDAC